MTFGLRQITSALLVAALATPVSFAHAAGGSDGTVPSPTPGVRASIDRAVQTVSAPLPGRVAPAALITPAFPRPATRDRSLKQMGGGGGGMMVMGIIGTLAGLAGTYYMVKMMKDSQKNDETTAP